MLLPDMIARRKSVRAFTSEPVDSETLGKIAAFMAAAKPLYPDIRVRGEIVDRESVSCFMPWTTDKLIAVFTEDKPGALENVGFLFQQVELYIQSLGLGACWLGMGRISAQGREILRRDDGLQFAIVLAFGHPRGEGKRKSLSEFRRKPLSAISDREDERLEPARLAPSSVNSQPWYFTHEGDVIHAYCVQHKILSVKLYNDMNRIDMGIALAHLYLTNPDTFRYFSAPAKPLKGYGYVGSLCL